MQQRLINDLSDQVSGLRADVSRAQAREVEQRLRANRAEAELASLKRVDEARRKLLAELIIKMHEKESRAEPGEEK